MVYNFHCKRILGLFSLYTFAQIAILPVPFLSVILPTVLTSSVVFWVFYFRSKNSGSAGSLLAHASIYFAILIYLLLDHDMADAVYYKEIFNIFYVNQVLLIILLLYYIVNNTHALCKYIFTLAPALVIVILASKCVIGGVSHSLPAKHVFIEHLQLCICAILSFVLVLQSVQVIKYFGHIFFLATIAIIYWRVLQGYEQWMMLLSSYYAVTIVILTAILYVTYSIAMLCGYIRRLLKSRQSVSGQQSVSGIE